MASKCQRKRVKHLKTATGWTSADVEIRKVIGALMEVAAIKKPELAARLGMTPPTLHARLRNPSDFRLVELRRLCDLATEYGVEVDHLTLGGAKRRI